MLALTGATGHLGQSILRQSKQKDRPVRAVVRHGSDRGLLSGFCSDVREASLDDEEALAEAFAGSEAVIHAAALIDIRRGQMDAMSRVNIEGTRNVIEACRRAGVRRLIYIGSIEAMDLKNPRRPIDEGHGFADGDAVMDYGTTKAEAARLVAEAGRSGGGIETVILCPTGILGPWDFRGGLLTTMVRRYLRGRIPASVPGSFDYVDVRDVAGAVLSAVGSGRSGEAYILSGHMAGVKELFGIIENEAGIRRFTPTLPWFIAALGGEFSERLSRFTGRPALFTRGSIDILQIDPRISHAKAEAELGFHPRPLERTIKDTISWIRGETDPNPAPTP